jgi:hypothetical protein
LRLRKSLPANSLLKSRAGLPTAPDFSPPSLG